eukprot:Sdes_comp20886_c0_seq1m17944
MSSYITNISFPTKHVTFQRASSGVLFWADQKSEWVNEKYLSRVFHINHATLIIQKRSEHLTRKDIQHMKQQKKIFQQAVAPQSSSENLSHHEGSDDTETHSSPSLSSKYHLSHPPHRASLPPFSSPISFDEYFSSVDRLSIDTLAFSTNPTPSKDQPAHHLGRRNIPFPPFSSLFFSISLIPNNFPSFSCEIFSAIKVKITKKSMNSTLWVCDDFPLKLETVVKLLTIISASDPRIEKLQDFLTTKLPEGFPIQLDIPVFPTTSATITFKTFLEAPLLQDLFTLPDNYQQEDLLETTQTVSSQGFDQRE